MAKGLTTSSYAIFALLAKLGEGSSDDLESAARSDLAGIWPLAHTTAFEEPSRLEALGYLASQRQPAGRRRAFQLTNRGWEALWRWRENPDISPPILRDEVWLEALVLEESRTTAKRPIEGCDRVRSAILAALGLL